MIELMDVTKSYQTNRGRNVVLDSVSFTFHAGANVGVLGKNGAGKSTLLRVIAGTEQPTEGDVQRRGSVSWPIGFGGGFAGSLSGEENCRLVARIYGADVDHVVDFARHFAELGEYFEMPVKTYSSGMKSRLAFGMSMAIDFDIYLVDEVTAVGDARFQDKCQRAFAARREKSSLILVSHNLKTVEAYCQEFVVLARGRLERFESLKDAQRRYETL